MGPSTEDQIRQAIESLSPPEALIGLWRVGEDPADLENLISAQPTLAAQLLKLGSSSFLGINESITTVSNAVRLLGTEAARNLSTVILIKDLLRPAHPPAPGFDRVEFWRHCVAAGIAAELVAHELEVGLPDIFFDAFFTAGFVHDLGVMALDLAAPQELARVAERVRGGSPILEAEREILGRTHAEIGGLLAEAWSFPPVFAQAVAFHHDPLAEEVTQGEVVCAAYLGDVLMMSSADRQYYGEDPLTESNPVLESLGIELPAAIAAREAALLRVEEVQALLDLPAK